MAEQEVMVRTISARLGELTAAYTNQAANFDALFDHRLWFSELATFGIDVEAFIQAYKQAEKQYRRGGLDIPKTQREERFDDITEYVGDDEVDTYSEIKDALFNSKYEIPAPCRSSRDDELFNLMAAQWNITKMLEHIKEANYQVRKGATDQLAVHNGFIHVNHDFAIKSTRNDPVILVEMPDGSPLLVDGHHRVHRDHASGVETMQLIIVPFEQQIRFLTSSEMIESLIEQREQHDRKRAKEQPVG